jgi:hypothetical protein
MRKIGTEKEIEAKRKKNAGRIGIFMLLLLLLSTLGYSFLNNSVDNVQNPTNTDEVIAGGYSAVIGGVQMSFINSPEEVKDVPVSALMRVQDYAGATLYIDSENSGITAEIASTLGKFALRVQEACYGECERDLPEKECNENLIIWKTSEKNVVYQDERCVFIEGNTKAVDAFLYKALGVN